MFNVQRSTFDVRALPLFLFFCTLSSLPAQSPLPTPPPEEDIRGPRATVAIPADGTLTTTQKILITTPVVAIAGFLIWFLMFRRVPQPPEVPPLEQAREALRAIDRERETLPAGELARQAADVVRQFIAAHFGLAAPQRTTEEFLHTLGTAPDSPLRAHTEQLQAFLTTCDQAKFAGAGFDSIERFALLETAGRFIQSAARATAPAPPDRSSPS